MPGTYTHTTRADGSILTGSIYNADHQNHITFNTPGGCDDYSTNVAQMQSTVDPGEVGTESLSTDLAGELQRIRNVLKEITGKTYWYETPGSNLLNVDSAFRVVGSADATKKLAFEVDTNVSTGTTRTATVPNRNGTMAFETTIAAYAADATLADGVSLARCSGATFQLILPPVASSTNREVTVKHLGTSLTQVYTLKGDNADNIIAQDGTFNTFPLYTYGEEVTLKCDGVSWYVHHHQATTDWADAGVMTITGTTGNPTKPTTPDIDKVYWRRQGNEVHLRYILQISSAAGSAAGTGNYLFGLPTNIAFDTTILTPVATAIATAVRSEASASFLRGAGYVSADSTSAALAVFFAYDTTHFQVQLFETTDGAAASIGALSSANHALTNGESAYNLEVNARAALWRI